MSGSMASRTMLRLLVKATQPTPLVFVYIYGGQNARVTREKDIMILMQGMVSIVEAVERLR